MPKWNQNRSEIDLESDKETKLRITDFPPFLPMKTRMRLAEDLSKINQKLCYKTILSESKTDQEK